MKKNSSQTDIGSLIPLTINNINELLNLRNVGRRSRVMNIYHSYLGERCLVASILVHLNSEFKNDYIELEFEDGSKIIRQRIGLTTQLSSLGKGLWHYFVCPITGKRCRKLFLTGNNFASRHGINNGYYQIQTESKKLRNALKVDRRVQASYAAIQKAFKPYFKPYYRINITKTHLEFQNAQAFLKKVRRSTNYMETGQL